MVVSSAPCSSVIGPQSRIYFVSLFPQEQKDDNLPTCISRPVIELFLAMSRKVCAQSSKSVYITSASHLHISIFKRTPFLNDALANICSIASAGYFTPHSVSSHPGSTALTRTFGPCVLAKHRINCNCAAFVTEYGMELPDVVRPAMLDVMMKTPPSVFLLKVSRAAFIR